MDDKPVVYILLGDDTYAMEQFVAALYSRMGEPSLADLNTARLDGRTASEEDIRNAAASLPFLAERRLVILTHPLEKLRSGEASQHFIALLDSLPPTAALVLLCEDTLAWNKDLRRTTWRTLNEGHWLSMWAQQAGKRALLRECVLPDPDKMPAWIVRQARERGGQFSPPAAQALASLVGSDTRVAALEIDKLLTYVAYERPVEAEDVSDCTAAISQASVFDLADAVAEGNPSRAIRLLRELLEEQDALSLFGVVVAHFRALLLSKEILLEGGGSGQIMSELRRPRFVAERLAGQAARYSLPALEDIFHRLAQMDLDAKSGVMALDLALEMFVAETNHEQRQ